MKTLSKDSWLSQIRQHEKRLEHRAFERRERAGVGIKHPVYDFLFEYYSFRPSQLLRWSPGVNILLEEASNSSFAGAAEFTRIESGMVLLPSQFPAHRIAYLEWAIKYLQLTAERPAQLSCFGLHEWAMLYKTEQPRYPDIPIRLSKIQLEHLCDSQQFRCTHYDAFRFFTPAARPLNALELSREQTSVHDQPGCIHVTMDLYRFAYKIAPFIPAELIADTFELAASAREIDMRASPYDLSSFGFDAIKVEEVSGRAQYAAAQLELSQRAQPLRKRVLEVYRNLLCSIQSS